MVTTDLLEGNGGATAQDNVVKLYDYLPSGENVPFYAVVNSDGAGNFISYTPVGYTIAGSQQVDATWTNMGYYTTVVDDTAVYALSSIPTGCNHADISIVPVGGPANVGLDYAWYQLNQFGPAPTTTSGFNFVYTGTRFDLQGIDEMNNFQIIAGAGMSVIVNVSFKYNPNMTV